MSSSPHAATTALNGPVEPFDFVLFGGSGDLAIRKLLPSLYFRQCAGQLPEDGRIVCVARSDFDTDGFRQHMEEECRQHIDANYCGDEEWQAFLSRIVYLRMDVTVFYLSVAPSLFTSISTGVQAAGLVTPVSRVAIEKPLGRDQASADVINDQLAAVFNESQIFRIDHYLGKETVQNLMALRFGNSLFEPLWRNEHISDVQITIAESLGVEGRGRFYDQTGALRDMVQNHLLQLLVILAMEPPVSVEPAAVRDEKIKVLRSLKPLVGRKVLENSVRGQYKAGAYAEGKVPGYLENDDIPNDSITETFVALKAEIGSWRWEGVPFYLRTGKRLEQKQTEIVVNFKRVPHSILQPEESIRMRIYVKAWGDEIALQPVHLNLDFNDVFQKRRMIAYERLIIDVLRGNPVLFMRRDEVSAAWAWIDPIQQAWDKFRYEPKPYTAGGWGPAAASTLISRDGFKWYEE